MTIHLIVKGRVQGVFYRGTAKDLAERLQITGWIKNTFDGNVEVTARGEIVAIDAFIEWCKQGPPRAIVKEVIISNATEEEFDGFQVIR